MKSILCIALLIVTMAGGLAVLSMGGDRKEKIDIMGYHDVVDLGSLENAARILQINIVR